MKKLVKHLVCDLDGTLLNNKKQISQADMETLHLLGEKGICRTIATGRSLYSFSEVLDEDLPIDFLISCAGASILNFKTKEILSSSVIGRGDVAELTNYLRKYSLDYQVREPEPNGHFYCYERFSTENTDFDYLAQMYAKYIRPIDLNNLNDASRIISILLDEAHISLFDKLSDKFSVIRATSPINNKSVWMEIYKKGVNKGSALRFINELIGVSLLETAGLGNDYNDLHFLNIVAQSFVTSNAPKYLTDRYQVTVSNNSSPLSEIVKNIGIL